MLVHIQDEYKMLDVMKFVMAVVVIAIHTGPEQSLSSVFFQQLFGLVYSVAVPFFFMSSGFLLFRKITIPLDEYGAQRIIAYLKKMCMLYVIWTALYLPLTIYGFYIDGLPPLKACVVFIRNVLVVGENYMSWPLWYLLALITAVCIIYVLLKLNVPKTWIVILSIVIAFCGIMLDYYKTNLIDMPIVDAYFSIFLKTRNGLFVGFLYVSMGMLCSQLKQITIFEIFSIALCLFLGYIFKIPLHNALFVLLIFILSITCKGKVCNSNLAIMMRKMSSVIYFIHMYFVACFVLILGLDKGIQLFALVTLLSLVASMFIIRSEQNALFG